MSDHSQLINTYVELLANLPVPISVATLERSGEVHFVNRALTEAFGYTLEHLPNLDEFAKHCLPDRGAREAALRWWVETLGQVKHDKVPAKPREFTLYDLYGKPRQTIVHPTIAHGLVISAFQDKTEQRSAERRLMSAEEQLREEAFALTENIPVGTYTMVLAPGQELADFRFMSTRFLELTGLTREEAESDPLKAFACVHPDDFDDWVALNQEAFARIEPFYGETRVVVNGEERWISAESIPRKLDDGTVVWEGVLMDLSRQKEAELALKKAHEELLQSSVRQTKLEEREALLQDMHDGFGSQLVMARQSLEKGQPDPRVLAETLDHCLADLHLLADTLQIREATLSQALSNFRHRVGQQLDGHGISFRWDINLDHAPRFSSRQLVQMMRIVQEAVTNAVRHSKGRQITVRAHFEPNQGLSLGVEDDGVGISDDAITGRGLINMRSRAEGLGATLTIEANHPGTQVALSVPPPPQA